MMLGRRGYEVALAEKTRELGGRVSRERKLPGLSAWERVASYRLGQIERASNISVYRESDLTAADILSFGYEHVAIATGSSWRRDGVARRLLQPFAAVGSADILSPDDLMTGKRPRHNKVAIYDDDHYYMGGVLAELLVKEGHAVSLVTPASEASTWMRMTMEQHFVQGRLMNLGVHIIGHHELRRAQDGQVGIGCIFTGKETVLEPCSIVMVTARLPHSELSRELHAHRDQWAGAGLKSVALIGDALAPGTIAAAVWSGRRYAEEFDEDRGQVAQGFRREVTGLSDPPFYWQTV